MNDPAMNPYLREAILTATPEQLQLMLYDGAIRFALKGRDAITAGDIEGSYNHLTHAQRIVSEMESGLRHDVAPELCAQMQMLYQFIFTKLVEANVNKDVHAVDAALKILRHQRDTWALLIDKIQKEVRGTPSPTSGPASKPPVHPSSYSTPHSQESDSPVSSISFEG